MRIAGIIPARYQSSRLPGKPIAKIGSKSIIQRVYESVTASSLDEVFIATDHHQILEHAREIGMNAVMTSPETATGTERCHEAIGQINQYFDCLINIQGDEPFIQPQQIDQIVHTFQNNPSTQIVTLGKKIEQQEDLMSPVVVKVVFNQQLRALYFSRSPIPYLRDESLAQWHLHFNFYKHIGIYGYKTKTLEELIKLPHSVLEKAESLEQLRWLDHGYPIHVIETAYESFGIDTQQDLDKANEYIQTQNTER